MRSPRARPARHADNSTPRLFVQVLQACSADVLFLDRLAWLGIKARVHSVFERVVNLETCSGTLYTIACRSLDDAPLSAVVDASRLSIGCAAVGDEVIGHGTRLTIGSRTTVSFASTAAWRPGLATYPASDATLRTNLSRLRVLLPDEGASGGAMSDAVRQDRFANAVTAKLQTHTRSLGDALMNGEFDKAASEARALIGLGPGLTPSGDDILVGMLCVLNVAGGPWQGWLAPLAAAIADGRHATNVISHAALAEAARGRVRASIGELVDAMTRGTPTRLVAATRRVLAIGSTSGTDIALGITTAFDAGLRAVHARRPFAAPATPERSRPPAHASSDSLGRGGSARANAA